MVTVDNLLPIYIYIYPSCKTKSEMCVCIVFGIDSILLKGVGLVCHYIVLLLCIHTSRGSMECCDVVIL